MKTMLRVFGGLIVICFIASCGGNPGIHSSRLTDVNNGDLKSAQSVFNPGETPALVVSNIDGNAAIEIYKIDTGKVVGEGEDVVKKGEAKWWVFPDLETGKYQGVLKVEGINKDSVEFEVIK